MTDNNKPPKTPKIILPNDPMSGEIQITYNLTLGYIDLKLQQCDLRSAALAMLKATDQIVNQAFEAAGLIVKTFKEETNATKKTDASKG